MVGKGRLPEDSAPYISVTRPRGIPPTPSALSREGDPVEIESTLTSWASPSFMTAPLPKCLSIWLSARSRAFVFSSFFTVGAPNRLSLEVNIFNAAMRYVLIMRG